MTQANSIAAPAYSALKRDRVLLAHGGGGQLTDELLADHVFPHISNRILDDLLDASDLGRQSGRLAFTIDSFVVQPWQFPGGDVGRLAIAGTVNDLAVTGAKPLAIALGVILAEGFPLANLDTVMNSVAATAKEANVRIATGDTKVVGHGHADGIYLITAGVGTIPTKRRLNPNRVRPGDKLILNGPIGEHGLAVMLAREMPDVRSVVTSDVAPLNSLTEALLAAGGNNVTFMRDPTRGGLSGLCADLAQRANLRVVLEESQILVHPAARHAADMLGLDPLDIANEGKVFVAVKPRAAEKVLRAMKSHPLGKDAAIVGHVEAASEGFCELHTQIGGRRIVQKPYGEQLPRIC
ncbi:MAG TPA: hydrogenase expression/formation protein HypE [Phycisphaerae bacterium]|nr:hydrogenase expression/formation protein HypE [Phycisphaerae bacterium]